jgi:hypothetical protein
MSALLDMSGVAPIGQVVSGGLDVSGLELEE